MTEPSKMPFSIPNANRLSSLAQMHELLVLLYKLLDKYDTTPIEERQRKWNSASRYWKNCKKLFAAETKTHGGKQPTRQSETLLQKAEQIATQTIINPTLLTKPQSTDLTKDKAQKTFVSIYEFFSILVWFKRDNYNIICHYPMIKQVYIEQENFLNGIQTQPLDLVKEYIIPRCTNMLEETTYLIRNFLTTEEDNTAETTLTHVTRYYTGITNLLSKQELLQNEREVLKKAFIYVFHFLNFARTCVLRADARNFKGERASSRAMHQKKKHTEKYKKNI